MDKLPDNAVTLPVSQFAREYGFNSASYVHTRYDRYKWGYSGRKGKEARAEYPGYDIVSFLGNCIVIVNGIEKQKKRRK